jgi:hypothetical protein
MVRPSLAPIHAISRFRPARPLAAALAVLLAMLAVLTMPAVARADTVMVVGVIVNDKQDRVGGALVRLYTTSTKIGRPLAEDRSSSRGVFRLYRTNISGDLGDLYVVYEEASGTAEPIRVSLKPADGGLAEARTADMVVLTVTAERQLSKEEAATHVAAIAKTQAILVQAGVRDSKTANETVQLRARQVIAAVPNFTGRDKEQFERSTIDKLKVLPFGTIDVSKGIRLAMEPKRDPTKGVS